MMKKIKLLAALAFIGFAANAQDIKFPALDPSPADFAYFPVNAVKVKKEDVSVPVIKVTYSRPSAKGRTVFGQLESFGKVWRLGANESTEIRFAKNVKIGDKNIAAGTYSLFAIPEEDKWIIIINKQTDRWGAFAYDEAKDIVRVTVPVKPLTTVVEALSIVFTPQPAGANLIIAWDKTSVEVPITFQ